jgi:hypothetical protein
MNNQVGVLVSNLATLGDYARFLLDAANLGEGLCAASLAGEQAEAQRVSRLLLDLFQREDLDFVRKDLGKLLVESQEATGTLGQLLAEHFGPDKKGPPST